MSSSPPSSRFAAVQDFRRARRQAALERVITRLRGKSVDLFSFEDVRQKLKAGARGTQELREIPLDAIVGSVGRYSEFTRSFLPRRGVSEYRWAQVRSAMTDLAGLPPVEVYQVGEVYFVIDGHHRVSAARRLDAPYIQAYVTELQPRVPLSPEDEPEDLVLKAELADFLEQTQLDRQRPESDLQLTSPGGYRTLEEHIQVHRYYMGQERGQAVPLEQAAAHWYDEVYAPVAEQIRRQGLLREFPDRTETDLYVWLSEHRAALEEALDMRVSSEAAAADLVQQGGSWLNQLASRTWQRVQDALVPESLESGPEPGWWRRHYLDARQREGQTQAATEAPTLAGAERLFADILVPLSGREGSWHALAQAFEVARREGAQIYGLHVVADEAHQEASEVQSLEHEFQRRCREAGLSGKMLVDVGQVQRQISRRARWVDLVIVHLAFPPGAQPLERLGSGFRTLLRRCARPVLATPGIASPLSRALLAYDGSPKAEEALYVATYVAGRWGISLVVITVLEGKHVTAGTMDRARAYLGDHGVEAAFVEGTGPAAEAILETAEASGTDLLLMGGYGHSPLMEVVLGSTVDQVLRESRRPMLICR
ncbi:MAG: universal stress protein [Anaerolineae bacterium]|nr:universal stress protein [Anaerolineae bacterium]